MERFEAKHGLCDPLNETMVLLDHIVKVFRLNNLYDPPCIRKLENDVQLLKPC